ncbi:MAG TPA: hypothetical protein DDY78_10270 [Planctomycetales bacterium]|nr:hypothetical protein [Planctomycetales bacterium]
MQEPMTFSRTRQGLRDLDAVKGPLNPMSGGPAPRSDVNVGSTERLCSSLAGGAMVLFGLSRMSLAGLALAGLGGSLLYRGTTGQCQLYKALGVNTAEGANQSSNAEMVYRPG